jgi:hypothetical protein
LRILIFEFLNWGVWFIEIKVIDLLWIEIFPELRDALSGDDPLRN